METVVAYIGLGSNVGDREATLRKAVDELGRIEGVRVIRVSRFIETDPVGGPAGQDKYLNGVAEVATTLGPRELLRALQGVEAALGRNRSAEERWGPRTCDLDILLMGNVVTNTAELTIPHPRMHERRFVLAPVAELAPEVLHPVLRKTAAQLLASLTRKSR